VTRTNNEQPPGAVPSHFLPVLCAAEVPTVTLYSLRHTAATLLLEAGIPMKVVQELAVEQLAEYMNRA
jgi:integrase